MKTKYFILAAIAAVGLASCADDVFVGDNSPNVVEETTVDDNGIRFGSGFKAVTRADKLGADAADLLGAKFYVTGVKGDGTPANMVDVFKTYSVEWAENTAGKTESNTSDWEYVGKTHPFPAEYTPNISSQTIKYWDYNTDYYDFAAYSLGKESSKATGTPITYTDASAAYTLSGTAAQLSTCYITDMQTVAKANYGGEVTLNFRSLATKVRMAIYETIPGYSVKDVVFYTDNTTGLKATILNSSDANYASGIHEVNATLFGDDVFYTAGTYEISFPNIGIDKAPGGASASSDYNKAHVKMQTSPAPSTEDTKAFGELNYVAGEGSLSGDNDYLGRTSATPSFAGLAADNYYQIVLPNEGGVILEMRVNYTLVNNDGGGETITVHGAKAFVPAIFTKWLPNYAYTYIFKISDNTNGWTSLTDTDPAGLFPITFDAIVLDSEETGHQTTITTVATPSITTYQKGHVYTDGPEYKASTENAIYVQVMMDNVLKGDLNTNGQLYSLSADKSEAEVLDALNIREITTASGYTLTGRNGLSLKTETSDATIAAVPGEDNNNITVNPGEAASFAATAGTYAYVYNTQTWNGIAETLDGTTTPSDWPGAYYTDPACTTVATASTPSATTYYKKEAYIYTAETMGSSAPDGWTTAGKWYKDPNGLTPVGDWNSTTDPGKIYYRKYAVNGQIFGVKVIKVVN